MFWYIILVIVSCTCNVLLNMITPSQFKLKDNMLEHNIGDSLTVPDDTLSLDEIVKRFSAGQSLVQPRPDTLASEVNADGTDNYVVLNDTVDTEVVDELVDGVKIAAALSGNYEMMVEKANLAASEESQKLTDEQ